MPEHGMATIRDADVLIWAASQIVRAENLGLSTSRFFRFTPYQLLRGVGRHHLVTHRFPRRGTTAVMMIVDFNQC